MRLLAGLVLLALERLSHPRSNPYRRFRAEDPRLSELAGEFFQPPYETYEFIHKRQYGELSLVETHLFYVRDPRDPSQIVGVFGAPLYSGPVFECDWEGNKAPGALGRSVTIVPELYMYGERVGPSLIRGAVEVIARLPDDCLVEATLNDDSESLAEALVPDDIQETIRYTMLVTTARRIRESARRAATTSSTHARLLAPLLKPYVPPDPDPMVHIWLEDELP